MRKIPTLFKRDPDDMKRVLDEVTPGCEWVLAGEGVATRKYDGTCVRVLAGEMWARREVKPGKQPPPDFEQVDHDETTGKTVGWIPVDESKEYARHWEAFFALAAQGAPEDGTYELIGPKVNQNPEGAPSHLLVRHDRAERYPAMNRPSGYDELESALTTLHWEGIVWHHPDGRMAKLKRRDFP